MPVSGVHFIESAVGLADCPKCSAMAGQSCHTPTGKVSRYTHNARIDRLRELHPEIDESARVSTQKFVETMERLKLEALPALAEFAKSLQNAPVRHVPTIERLHNGMRYIKCGDVQIAAESGYRTLADMPQEIITAVEEYNKRRGH